MMPPEHGHRLPDLLPKGQLVEIEDSYTVVPLDQPRQLADAVRAFITSTADQSRWTQPPPKRNQPPAR
jgi:hypothetical protein